MGTKYCIQCKEMYCDTCYAYMHRKGRLAIHSFERAVPVCASCNQRSAQWKRLYPDEDAAYLAAAFGLESERSVGLDVARGGYKFKYKKLLSLLCTVCHKEKFGDPNPEPDPELDPDGAARPMVERIPYYGLEGSKAVAKRLRENYLALLRKQSEEMYQAKLPALMQASATKIQKVRPPSLAPPSPPSSLTRCRPPPTAHRPPYTAHQPVLSPLPLPRLPPTACNRYSGAVTPA